MVMRLKFSILLACSLALLSVSCVKEALGLTPIDKGDVSLDLYGFIAEGKVVFAAHTPLIGLYIIGLTSIHLY